MRAAITMFAVYTSPFLSLALLSPMLADGRRWGDLLRRLGVVVALSSVGLVVAGYALRPAYHDPRMSPGGLFGLMLITAAFIALALIPGILALWWQFHVRADRQTQRVVTTVTTLLFGFLCFPLLGVYVGCALTGDCL